MANLTRRGALASAAAVPLTLQAQIAAAATPKDTLVIAKQIDDMITLDQIGRAHV